MGGRIGDKVVTEHGTITVPKDPKKPDPNDVVKYDVLGAAVGDSSGVTKERLFVGPKALNVLESVRSNTAPGQMNGPDLRDVVDFGFFSLVARPLFLWLKWTHEHMARNWGVSIIILTVIINLALLPLRITSEEMLDDVMTTPSAALIHDLASVDGDILILGVGGKMGPTLARMARRAGT